MWAAFIFWERRAAEPVLAPSLFRNSVFSVSAVSTALQSAGMFGAIMFLPLFVQGVMGRSATNSGIILMPMMLGAIVTSIGAGQLLSRTGKYKLVVIAGFVGFIFGTFMLSRMPMDVSSFALARNMVIVGWGLGVGMSAFVVIVQNVFPTHRLGEVTAGLQFFRSLGATIGLAVFGTILNNVFARSLAEQMPAKLKALSASGAAVGKLDNPQVLLSPGAREQLSAEFARLGSQGQDLLREFMLAVRVSLDHAIGELFVLSTIVGIVGLVVVLFLKEVPLRRTHAPTDEMTGV